MLKRKSFSRRNLNLRLDQVDSRHQFGYRMLNLNPRIDLDKVKIVIRINDKLDRARIEILGILNHSDGGFTHRISRVLRDSRRRRFLD